MSFFNWNKKKDESQEALLYDKDDNKDLKNDTITTKATAPPRFHYYDGLRGWASLQVYASHNYSQSFHKVDSNGLFTKIFKNILIGRRYHIPIFFVLSGRLIALSLLKRPTLPNFTSTCVRRVLRLGFPLFGGFFLFWFFGALGFYKINVLSEELKKNSPIAYLNHFKENPWVKDPDWRQFSRIFFGIAQLFNFHNLSYPVQGVIWTLYVEFFNSYYIYILAMIASQCNVVGKVLIYSVVQIFSLFSFRSEPHTPDGNAAYFVGGLIIAELANAGLYKWINTKSYWWIVHAIFFFIPIVAFVPDVQASVEDFINNDIYKRLIMTKGSEVIDNNWVKDRQVWFRVDLFRYLVGTCCITLLELNSIVRGLFSTKVMKWLGMASYGLYLIHPMWSSIMYGRLIPIVDTLFSGFSHLTQAGFKIN
ncbi:hypothetical protein HK099_008037 [Clydaea vesicula]|uniref:Acyltransferase 3 domain-containing protein n=1 Tax=Clydaea vesicula TaxID=447962 RepID=A0AAD5TYA1_9FUNG|nr:hypothetical protein HK099_008037 [Clydaea vesicula]KAJ3378172.1 hypothetical protein HDU92_007605 [Lobulomyces angularis]